MIPLFLLAASLLSSSALAATTCNGDDSLCDRSYSNMTFLGAHDSYAVGTSLADDQSSGVTDQLNDGIRTLQIQAHNMSDGIHLCHSACSLLDGGLMESYLAEVNTWVSANPNEVITIVIVNSDSLPPTAYESAFQSSGLQSHVYSPPSAAIAFNAWPTLGSLIDAGTTVVVFMNYDADFNQVPWIIDEFSNMFEDSYNDVDTTWSCAANRSGSNPASSLMMVNHFLDVVYDLAGTAIYIPDKDAINTTNSESSLEIHVDNCMTLWGRHPNHILLDFYNSNGNAPFDYVAQLNGVPAPTTNVQAVAPGGGENSSSGNGTDSSNQAQISSSSRSSTGSGGAYGRAGMLPTESWTLTVSLIGMGLGGGVVSLWL
ncbi:PLC-like phosphodiesterase [Kockovaella imperatae]|uniref:PLC-like phosphodiesterase n=1 Tax=Kockovaella imperatae TaxID=4999 RepID=A0A1Y1UJW5_9TREE|nr:PLC-like phosphodiesterase [Kockovaella imperatae]ORX37817.1 PLC-like phosphodiesterase [Kockovaella imperatae]